jgi:hypothetical protein
VERFLGDMALVENWIIDADFVLNGKRILVIGAGPSGLSAAYHLRLPNDLTFTLWARTYPRTLSHPDGSIYRLPPVQFFI